MMFERGNRCAPLILREPQDERDGASSLGDPIGVNG